MYSMKEIHAIIQGHVQGVFFRATTEKKAKKLGITGYVKNNPNGTVEVRAQGEEEKLHDFIDYLNEGPDMAEVKDVDIQWGDKPTRQFDGFKIEY